MTQKKNTIETIYEVGKFSARKNGTDYEIIKDANFIVNAYIDNFQTVVYDEYNYPYPEYGCTEEQYAEMVAAMKKGFEEILNNFKDVVEIFLKTYKEYEDVDMGEYPNEKHRAYFIVEDIELAISDLLNYHNGKKDREVLRNLTETYVKCNKYIIK